MSRFSAGGAGKRSIEVGISRPSRDTMLSDVSSNA
jgi:hypothetical protein